MNTRILRSIRLNWAARTIKSKTFTRITAMALFVAAITCLCGALAVPAHGVNPGSRVSLGPENASAGIAVTVWLKPHNEGTLNVLLQQMYDKNSPNYHKWLTPEQFKAQFAPTTQEMATVRNFLAANNMTVTSVHPNNHFVVAQGNVGDAQRAFNTQVNRVMVNGQVHRVSASVPSVAGSAGALVASVQGLSDHHRYMANVTRARNPDTGAPYAGVSPFSAGADGLFFSANCLRPPQTVTFTTGGGLPKATYTGNRYGANITNTQPPNLPPCGYDAVEMQKAYGLKPLINHGLDGSGQTIVIVDAFGSNTILEDANLFSQLNGLPPLTTTGPNANFAIIKPGGPVKCTAKNGCIAGNWQFETTLDVEWAHAMAPNANIVLVVSVDNNDVSLDTANLYAIESGFGSVISNSFGIPEIVLVDEAPSELIVENQIAKTAAALGISLNVSSGDAGDDLALDTDVFGIPATSVDALADSPFVTAVGGTSTFLNHQNQIKLQTGWGLNFVRIAEPTPNPPTIPPLFFGFQGGAGGGTSVYFAKPSYQRQLPGTKRKVPDISMNADPDTGNEIIVTPDSVPGHPQEVDVFGGTSLSTPMFSAVWAIANQAAIDAGIGVPLGQAAPLLYSLPGGAITDVNVTAADTQNNVTGTIYNPPNPPQHLSADFLAEPQPPVKRYVSALYHSPFSTRWDVFTFGTDSSLTTAPGWDDVTGLGVPAPGFVQAVVQEAQK
jgi:subtilase family serine protease